MLHIIIIIFWWLYSWLFFIVSRIIWDGFSEVRLHCSIGQGPLPWRELCRHEFWKVKLMQKRYLNCLSLLLNIPWYADYIWYVLHIQELEKNLKTTCEEFIMSVTKLVVDPLLSFVTKVCHFYILKSTIKASLVDTLTVLAINGSHLWYSL